MSFKYDVSFESATPPQVDVEFLAALCALDDRIDDLADTETLADDSLQSTEGFLDGLLGDTNTGPIGAIIAYARNNLISVKEQVEICKKKLDGTSDADIEKRSQQLFIRVRSKYLPPYDEFIKGCNALTKMLLLAGKSGANTEKLVECLKGSMFYDVKKGGKTGQQNVNWEYILVRNLALLVNGVVPGAGAGMRVYERAWYQPSEPVGKRGWSNRKAFENGLSAMDTLLSAFDSTIRALRNAKDPDPAAFQSVKWAEREVVYLGRGLTTAIRKLYAGGFTRFVSNRYIH